MPATLQANTTFSYFAATSSIGLFLHSYIKASVNFINCSATISRALLRCTKTLNCFFGLSAYLTENTVSTFTVTMVTGCATTYYILKAQLFLLFLSAYVTENTQADSKM